MNKVSLKQFGARNIYVISEKQNTKRRQQFIQDWQHFTDFNYQFIDAIMGKEIHIRSLLEQGRLKSFWCGEAAITRNIIGCFESHRKVWKKIAESSPRSDDYSLVLEDDARLTPHFTSTAIQSGEFNKILKFIDNATVNCFWWGRADQRVSGNSHNKFTKIPDPYLSLGAHAYMIRRSFAELLLNESEKIEMPVDVLISHQCRRMGRSYAPNYSYIRQVQHMLGQRFFIDGHINEMWGSTTQPQRKDGSGNVMKDMYIHISEDFKPFVKNVTPNYFNNEAAGYLIELGRDGKVLI